VDTLAVQNDGKILAAGTFETARGAEVLVRLNADGSLDSSFLPQGPILYCTAILPLNNGQILVGGLASSAGDGFVRRLNADGSVDATFNAPAFNDYVRAIALDAAGRVIVGGSFTAAGQQPHSRLARLNSDGSLDANWTLGANGIVKAMASDADGNLIVGGLFSQIGGQTHNGIARLLLQHAPSFKSMATGTNGHFTANLQADAGKTYAVETSSDLKSWTPFSIQTATISGLQIQDADASRKSLCFFRAKLIE